MAIDGSTGDSGGIDSLAVYVSVFEKLGFLAVVIGVALLLISPWVAKKMR
jgi:dipeptide/tripeptide permease